MNAPYRLGPPTSLRDIATDGALAQLDADAADLEASSPIAAVDFSAPGPHDDTLDALVDLLIQRAGSDSQRATGTRVAVIRDGQWHWLTHRAEAFDLPELRGAHEATDLHIMSARTLCGNAPVFLAPHENGAVSVVALDGTLPAGPTRAVLTWGTPTLAPDMDVTRAIAAFAASRGLGSHITEQGLLLDDGLNITIANNTVTDVGGGLTYRDVLSDAYFTSAEHQLLFQGRYSGATVLANVKAGTATIQPATHAPFQASMQVLATVKDGTATWAWADPHIQRTPADQASRRVRHFAIQHGIPQFLRPTVPVDEFLEFAVAAKPIAGVWTHARAPLSPNTSAIVLLGAPELALPQPWQEAVDATVAAVQGADLDLPRALAAYARNRGLTVGSDGTIRV